MKRRTASVNFRIARIVDAPPVEEDDLHDWRNKCSADCYSPIKYVCAWDYRRKNGKSATARRWYCRVHGELFCVRHGILLENIPETIWEHRRANDHAWAYAPKREGEDR